MILAFSKYCKPSVDTKCTFASEVTGTRQNHKFCQILYVFQLSGNFSILALQFAFALCDGFDSRLEPIAFDILQYVAGGCWLEKRKLTSQSPSITVRFSVQYNLKITSVILFLFINILSGLHAV